MVETLPSLTLFRSLTNKSEEIIKLFHLPIGQKYIKNKSFYRLIFKLFT